MSEKTFIGLGNFFKLIFGGTTVVEDQPFSFGCVPALVVAFVLMVLGAIAIATSVGLSARKKGNFKIQLGLTIGIVVALVVAGILFIMTKELFYESQVKPLGEEWSEYSEYFKLGYAPYVAGGMCIGGGTIFAAANIIGHAK